MIDKKHLIFLVVIIAIVILFYNNRNKKEKFDTYSKTKNVTYRTPGFKTNKEIKKEQCEMLNLEKQKIKKILKTENCENTENLETRDQINMGANCRNNITREIVYDFNDDDCDSGIDYDVEVISGPELMDKNMNSGFEPANKVSFEDKYVLFIDE